MVLHFNHFSIGQIFAVIGAQNAVHRRLGEVLFEAGSSFFLRSLMPELFFIARSASQIAVAGEVPTNQLAHCLGLIELVLV